MRRVLLSLALLVPITAEAANNTVLLTPCSSGCVTMRSQDVGAGVESAVNILGDTSGNAIYGTAGTANANVLTVQGIASMTPVQVSQATAASLNATVVGTGTFAVQAAQSGTWNITNISGTVSLPTGASTAAKQPALGTAGTAATDVLTVQGIASMTPLNVNVAASAITQAVSVASGQIVDGGDVTQGAKADAASCTGSQTVVSCLKQIDTDIKATGTVQGSAASGSSVSGNPLFNGGRAQNAEQTAVTNGQAVGLAADLVGKLIVLPYANPENFVSGVTAAMTGTTSTSLLAAPASGLRNYLTHLMCTNSHATVGTFVLVQDGSGGTTIYEGYAAAVGGGFSMTLPVPLRQPTTATALFVQDVTTGANVICSGSGYKGI